MAKTKHNNLLDSIDVIITDAKNKGIVHLYAEDESFTGRNVKINGKNLFHFGTTGYLGLEQDNRLKEAGIDAIRRYGTQFPLSKTFLSYSIYKDLEDNLLEMYNNPVLISKNSTLSHIAVIPSAVRDEDSVILDHQVHWTVQTACQLLKLRGIPVEMIRHSNMNMLEDKIKELKDKSKKIWHMIDGVYSMFGDFAPLKDLLYLQQKYPQLHLYIDDVHGMSWAGKHGTGWVMSQLNELNDQTLLTATLSKSFGATGGIMVCSNKELYRKIKTFGGPLTFSAQLEPASVASALASAKIHLSSEIYEMQKELEQKIIFCNKLIKNSNLPLVEENNCPVFFIGTGFPATGYNYVNKIMDQGFYVNLGVFPAVPVKNSGVRFTISRHNAMEDIQKLVEVLEFNYSKTIKEEGKSENQIRKIFNLPLLPESSENIKKHDNSLTLYHTNNIHNIKEKEWNENWRDCGVFDWKGLCFLQDTFTKNELKEHNWSFDYFIITDQNGKIILKTFFTKALWKDDLLAPPAVSQKIEEKRKSDPYYLTSEVLSMGSLFTEGNHLYLDKSNSEWKIALNLLIDQIVNIDESAKTSMIVLRDFIDNDPELKKYFVDQGFITIDMPDSCVIKELTWNNEEEFLSSLSYKSRRHVRTDILKFEHLFEVEIKNTITPNEMDIFYQLFMNVKNNNYDINTFNFPKKILEKMSLDPQWEFIILSLKEDVEKNPVAVMFSYKNSMDIYCPAFIGLDYQFLEKYNIYRQALYQSIKRARFLNFKEVDLGFSASFEKKKLGALIIPKIAYLQAKDNFNLELIGAISNSKA